MEGFPEPVEIVMFSNEGTEIRYIIYVSLKVKLVIVYW